MQYNVKMNEELFNRWKDLDNPFELMKAIVQNDITLTKAQLDEWISVYVGTRDRYAKKLDKLYSETVEYIRSCQQ